MRKNITQPADWWAAFEDQANAEGVNLSEWVGACCVANLPVPVQKALRGRKSVGRPKKPKADSK